MPDDDDPTARRRFDRDLVVSFAAVAISLCALGASLVQTMVMRAQQHASVWPRLTVSLDGDSAHFTLSVRNAGVGPAQVVWAQASFDGRPVDGWPALLDHALDAAPGLPAGEEMRADLSMGSVSGNVLVPGEASRVFAVEGRAARPLLAVAARIGLRACYCSVYDRCWRLDEPRVGARVGAARVTPVAGCDPPPDPRV